jgi:oligopeptide transport system ATP-binding protein
MAADALLAIRGLTVSFQRERSGPVSRALRGVDLSVAASEIHGLVGESGCGKTVTSTAVMGLLAAPPARIEAGSILFDGRDLLGLSAEERRKVRGRQIAMVFQEPARYLNPAFRVGTQITEMLALHLGMKRREAEERAAELATLVGLGGSRRVLQAYPHELSGGMKQRAMIAMAISCNPRLLIADEPTTALDVTLQLQILRLIVRLRETFRMGILFISHDLRLVRTIADRVTVMYAGRAVETASAGAIYRDALHPYTRLLLASIPAAQKRGTRLRVIPGRVPDAQAIPPGCAFHPRCPLAEDRCRTEMPESLERAPGHTAACHFVGKPWPA